MALNEADIDRVASHTPLLHLYDWKRVLCELQLPMFTNVRLQIAALIRAVLRSIVST